MSFLGTCEESMVFELTLLDEKLLSKVAADYLHLIKEFRKRVFKSNLLIILIIKTLKKNSNYSIKKRSLAKEHKQTRKNKTAANAKMKSETLS